MHEGEDDFVVFVQKEQLFCATEQEVKQINLSDHTEKQIIIPKEGRYLARVRSEREGIIYYSTSDEEYNYINYVYHMQDGTTKKLDFGETYVGCSIIQRNETGMFVRAKREDKKTDLLYVWFEDYENGNLKNAVFLEQQE